VGRRVLEDDEEGGTDEVGGNVAELMEEEKGPDEKAVRFKKEGCRRMPGESSRLLLLLGASFLMPR